MRREAGRRVGLKRKACESDPPVVPIKRQRFSQQYFNKSFTNNLPTKVPLLNLHVPMNHMNRKRGMFYNIQLVGDDFFLEIGRRNLRYPVHPRPGTEIEEINLMRSGFKLKNAADAIRKAKHLSKNVLIYLGTEDILCGRTFPDLRYDFEELVEALQERNVTPIFCTLAPIANHLHEPEMKDTISLFNTYLRSQQNLFILDLNKIFLNSRGKTDFNNFNYNPTFVTGSSHSHVLWNQKGREQVLSAIKTCLVNSFY